MLHPVPQHAMQSVILDGDTPEQLFLMASATYWRFSYIRACQFGVNSVQLYKLLVGRQNRVVHSLDIVPALPPLDNYAPVDYGVPFQLCSPWQEVQLMQHDSAPLRRLGQLHDQVRACGKHCTRNLHPGAEYRLRAGSLLSLSESAPGS